MLAVAVPDVGWATDGYWMPNGGDPPYFQTAQEALAANLGRPPLYLPHLDFPATVWFWCGDWMNWDNRGGASVFVEPAGGCSQQFYPTDDTEIVMRGPDTNYGSSTEMRVENLYGHPSHPVYWEIDALTKFDLSSIPAGTNITSAILHLYYYNWWDNNPAGRALTCYRITGNWNEETVTWNTRPGHAGQVTSSAIVPPAPGVWMAWNVTGDVQAFVNNPGINFGWEIMDEVPWNKFNIPWTRFRTKEYGSSIPYLAVEFTCGNQPPVANAGGPYTAECQGTRTSVPLDGRGSYDPDPNDALTYAWSTDCPGALFDDKTSPTALLTIDSETPCPLVCDVTLTVTDDSGEYDACWTTVTVEDTTPPQLTVDTTPITVVDGDCSGDEEVMLPIATATDACGSVTITDDAPPTFPAGQTTTVTYTATDECGNANTATVNVTVEYGANIVVRAAKHVVGTGNHPDSTKEPLVGLEVCAYDKSDGSCARLTCGGISHQHYQCIVDECEPVNCAVGNENGEALINLPPGDYVVIAADATKTVLPDPLGVSASDLMCGETQTKYLQQIVRADGSKIPGKTTRLTGSELLIIEPEYVLWDDTEQLYPFVFETIGEWGVTVTVDPPEGFLVDYELLSEDVDNELEAVQFTITELGSDLVATGTTFQVHHNGRPHTVRSSVGIALTPEYALSRGFNVEDLRQRGLIKERRPVVDVPRRGRGGR